MTHSANLAIHFEQRIKASNGAFVLSHPRSFVNVCFWWVPPALRPFQPAKASQQDLATLDKVGQETVCSAGTLHVQPAARPQGFAIADFRWTTHAVTLSWWLGCVSNGIMRVLACIWACNARTSCCKFLPVAAVMAAAGVMSLQLLKEW